MNKLDGIYRLTRDSTVRAHARRFSIGLVLLIILLGTVASNTTPKTVLGETGAVSSNRIFSDGFESQDMGGWASPGGVAMTTQTTTKHSGAAAAECITTSNNCLERETFANTPQTAPFWFRLYFYIKTAGSNNNNPLICWDDNTGVTIRICLAINPSRVLGIFNQTAGSPNGNASGSTALSTNTWYRIEIGIDNTTTSATTVSVRLNGVSEIATTTMNILGGINMLEIGDRNNDTVDWLYDDFAINGNSTRSDNWPGDGKIVNIAPGSAGDNTTWTQNGTCTGGNFGCINETPPNGSTNFVSTATVNNTDDYGLASFSGAGITAGDLIKLVSVGIEATSSGRTVLGTDQGTSTLNTRLKASSGGTVTSSANITFDFPSYNYNDDALGLYGITSYTLPGTNTPWTTSNLSAAQIGVKFITSDNAARTAKTTSMWLMVEYQSSSGGRLWSSGFESNSTSADVEWTTTTGSPTIQTSTVRSGTYAMQTASAGAQSFMQYSFQSANANGAFFVRGYLWIGTANSAEYSVMEMRDTSNARQAWLTLTTSNTLKLFSTSSSNAQIGSASSALTAGAWYRVEMKFDRTAAAGSQIVAAQLNGTSIATSSSLTITNGIARLALGNNIGNTASPTTGQMMWDDVAINQNLGTTQNSYPGDGNIMYLRPNAAGDNSGFTKNGAGCTGGSNYQCANETTPDDATTYASATTANTIDDYNVANTGLSSSDTITLVQVGVRFNTSSATEEDFRVRLKDAASAIPIESNNLNPASTTWVTNSTASPFNYALTAYTRPEQSSSWTAATVDSAQIGIRDYNAGTGTVEVTNEWLLVEYGASIAGTVYDTDETTAITSQPTVRVKVNGAGSYSTTAAANGTYTITSVVYGAGDAITVYLDTNGGIVGATFTTGKAGALTGIDIYKNRAATRCDSSCSLTNTNINNWDKDNDTDIHAAVSGSNLTVDNDWKLLVKANTFAPGGTITMSTGGSNTYSGDVEIKSGTTLNMAGNALSISGNYTNSGTFTSSSNTTTFTSTGSKTIAGTLGSTSAFYDLTFNGSGGTWTFSAAPTVNDNLTITLGTVDDGANQITGNATATMSMSSGTTLKLGSGTATLFPSSFTNGHTTLNSASTVIYKATVAQTISGTPTYGNLQLSAASGTPTKTLAAATTVAGNLTIDASNTLDASSGNNYNITLSGNYTNNGTFTARNDTVTLNGSAQQTLSGTMTSGSAFYDLTDTNASGANASDCERTGFTPSIIFGASATSTHNLTFTTASSRIEYKSGSTYTFTNINWNGQATGTRIYFRNSAASGTWLLNVSGTQTAVSKINVSRSNASGGSQIVANDGSNVDCNNNTNWLFTSNTAPNSPTSLVQKRTTAGTTLATGDWTNETKATFTATATDTDNPDTLQLCVEVIPIASSFTNTETACGSGVAYSGTGVTVTYNNTTLSDATEYKWQARAKDAAGAYSSWVDYGSNGASRDFGVDTTAPTTGSVADGAGADTDYNDSSLTALSANWSGFSGTVSGIAEYDYSIGITAGGTTVLSWTSNGTSTSVTASGLVLHTNVLYYTNVRAVDNAGNTSSVVSSNGQWVLPQLTFSLSSNSLTFSNLNSGNNNQNTQTTTITTSTNAYGGYVVSAYAGGLLTSGVTTIPMFAAGSYASPASWGSGQCSGTSCGWGYTSSDTTISGANKFSGGTLYAPFSLTAPGDVVADHTTAVDGTSGAVSNEAFTITCKLAVSKLQPSLTYSGTIYYIATGTF